ncbi:MAG: SusC/RagA family TonB-linked outer membrane protein [Candidatus Cryptobacteroides sp.]
MKLTIQRIFATFAVFSTCMATALAQNTIKGVVTDANEETLIGAAVMIKGTATGAVTDINGSYTINASSDAILVFSSIGYETLEVPVDGRAVINVVMKEDTQLIDESVVIGYGTMSRKNFTGSVANVKMNDSPIMNTLSTNALSLLDGVVTGINFGKSGEAGSTPSMVVRGQKSIASTSADPLIVLNGVIFTGSMNDIDPNIIESMSVLKDATSLAAYGSQAANGVIMITTKKGNMGKPKVNFSASVALSQPGYRPDVKSPEQYIELMNIRHNTDDPTNWMSTLELNRYKSGETVDWYGLINRTGVNQNYALNVSGATENVSYFVSAGYLNNKNFIVGDQFDRFNTNVRLNAKVNKYISVGFHSNLSKTRNDGIRPNYEAAVTLSPFTEPYLSDGRYRLYVDGVETTTVNPLWNVFNGVDHENRRSSLVTGGDLEIKIPGVKGLSFKITGSYTTNNTTIRHFVHETNYANLSLGEDAYTTKAQDAYLANANGYITENKYTSWVLDNILTYTREFGKHYVNASLVYTRDSQKFDSHNTTASDFSAVGNTNLGFDGLNLAAAQKAGAIAYTLHNDVGYLARAIYSYNNTYHFNASVRRDGSSVFGSENKWGVFPAVGFAWTMSNEKFMENATAVDNLKIKASWGINGNQSLAPYGTLSTLNVGQSGGIAAFFGDQISWGQSVAALGNASLGWESTQSVNFGAETDLLKNRIHFEIDSYISKTTNQIFNRNVPVMGAGVTTQKATMGQVNNWGIEANLTTHNIKRADFNWRTTLTFTINRNKLVSLYGDGQDDITNSLFLGHSLGAIYGYKWIGVVQETDTDYMAANGANPGDAKYANLDGSEDGRITSSDRTILGYAKDNFRMSMQNTFTYKGFTLYLLFNGVFSGGGYGMAANNAAYLTEDGYGSRSALNHPFWTAENPSNIYPAYNFMDKERFTALQPYGFVRLQEANLSYSFNPALLKKAKISALKLFISGSNLFFIAPGWTGSDPEVRSYASAQLPRTFTFGANISF